MKHFKVTGQLMTATVDVQNMGEQSNMSEQGFKRFRRRHAPAVEAAVKPIPASQQRDPVAIDAGKMAEAPSLEDIQSAHPAFERVASRSALPPAPLPEPWERIRQVPFDAVEQEAKHLPLVNRLRADPATRSFDLLRTRLLHTLQARGWKRVAVCAPTAGCGTTFVATNLALSLARVPGSRTILMDMNFRRPAVGHALGMNAPTALTDYLSGRVPMQDYLLRPLPSLAVGLNAEANDDGAEILHSRSCRDALDAMMQLSGTDTMIFDLPPLLEHDDSVAFLPQVDGVLLISDGNATMAEQLAKCEKMLAGQTQLLGVVLNRARRAETPLG